jgi:hypothetical protein
MMLFAIALLSFASAMPMFSLLSHAAESASNYLNPFDQDYANYLSDQERFDFDRECNSQDSLDEMEKCVKQRFPATFSVDGDVVKEVAASAEARTTTTNERQSNSQRSTVPQVIDRQAGHRDFSVNQLTSQRQTATAVAVKEDPAVVTKKDDDDNEWQMLDPPYGEKAIEVKDEQEWAIINPAKKQGSFFGDKLRI